MKKKFFLNIFVLFLAFKTEAQSSGRMDDFVFAAQVRQFEKLWKVEKLRSEPKYYEGQKKLLTDALEKFKEASAFAQNSSEISPKFAESYLRLYLLLIDNESSSFTTDLLRNFQKKHSSAYKRAFQKLLPENKETIEESFRTFPPSKKIPHKSKS